MRLVHDGMEAVEIIAMHFEKRANALLVQRAAQPRLDTGDGLAAQHIDGRRIIGAQEFGALVRLSHAEDMRDERRRDTGAVLARETMDEARPVALHQRA